MKIIAKTIDGQEFIYSIKSAHKVNAKKAQEIADALNGARYTLKDGEKWYVYEVEEWENAYLYAETQSFYFTKGGALKRRASAY